ncbi:MAG: hypothetical protein QM753_07390 [Thermomicrobiales bacterium]
MAKKAQPAPVAVRITALEMTAPPKQSLPVPVNVHTAILGAPRKSRSPSTVFSTGRWAAAGTGWTGCAWTTRRWPRR